MNGSGRIMLLSMMRISGSSRLKAWTWVVAMPGPETIRSAIRSRPIPVSLNRPSGPVLAAMERSFAVEPRSSRNWSSGRFSSPCQRLLAAPLRALAIQPARSPLPSNQTRAALTVAPATGRPSRSMIRPSIGGPSSVERHDLLGRPVGPQDPLGPAEPVSGAEATSQGKRACSRRTRHAPGLGQADGEPAVRPAGRLGQGLRLAVDVGPSRRRRRRACRRGRRPVP